MPRKPTFNSDNEKLCTCCNEFKPLDDFYKSSRGHYQSHCKRCMINYTKSLKKRNEEFYNPRQLLY